MLTPWPAKAASPWISNGITAFRVGTPRRAGGGAPCGRTEPSTTGLAISRCEGLKASAKCTVPPGVSTSEENPMWYLTSPVLLSATRRLPSNSPNSSLGPCR